VGNRALRADGAVQAAAPGEPAGTGVRSSPTRSRPRPRTAAARSGPGSAGGPAPG
jgi:hypothetical protein